MSSGEDGGFEMGVEEVKIKLIGRYKFRRWVEGGLE